MNKVLAIFLVACLAACDNAGGVKAELDSAVNDVKNSKALDSIEAKGGRILDSVGQKGGELWDSTKSKGGKLIKRADYKLDDLKKKDSID
jgi:hypothetical protein